MKPFRSYSSRETMEFGRALAAKILAAKSEPRAATVIALSGDLGAGKTTFTQGFAKGLGITRRPVSPTFVIMRRYAVSVGKRNLYHIDAYRLRKPDALEILGFQEIVADPKSIVLIEWPERVKKFMPKGATWLTFKHGKKENERVIISR